MPRRTALIVGNLEYQDARLSRLVSPQADVLELANVLQSVELGQFDEVRTLFNQTHGVVTREMWRFFRSATSADDMVLLYFSGHGLLDDHGRLFLALADTETELLRATALAASLITEAMDSSRSRRQVLILDCCHSGAFERGAKAAMGQSVGTTTVFEGNSGAYQQEGQGRVVLTATDAMQFAWEGDNLNGTAERSVFTRHLIEGLKTGGADLNGDGLIGVDELYEYVHARVVDQTPRQEPCKFARMVKGEFVIARRPPGTEEPVPLRPDIEEDLASHSATVRTAAVEALSDWLRGRHVGRVLAARAELERLAAGDDSFSVRAAARAALTRQGADSGDPAGGRDVVDAPVADAGPEVVPPTELEPSAQVEPTAQVAQPEDPRPAAVARPPEAVHAPPMARPPAVAPQPAIGGGGGWPACALVLALDGLSAAVLIVAVGTLAGAASPAAVTGVLLLLATIALAGFVVVRAGPATLRGHAAAVAAVVAGALLAVASAAALAAAAAELAIASAAVGLGLEVAAGTWLTDRDASMPARLSWLGIAAVPALLLLAFAAVVSTFADPEVRVPLVAWFVVIGVGPCAAWSLLLTVPLLRQVRRRPAPPGGWWWDGRQWVRTEPGRHDRG